MLDSAVLRNPKSTNWLSFENPVARYVARTPADVVDILNKVQQQVDSEGLYAVGFITYEAAPAFDEALVTHAQGLLPVACFSLFASPAILDVLPAKREPGSPAVAWHLRTEREAYLESIARIKQQIELGNCYQVNFSIRQQATIDADPWDLFCDVAADAPYSAYLHCSDFTVVSASPELLFSLEGSELICRPMKGTAKRGTTTAEDREASLALFESTKDRAENVMIADMVRNDLGRVADPGSVEVRSLYDIEKYPTVWQMTSTVAATSHSTIPDILGALFPGASVTGAPKASSMTIITELEDSPREIYTGSIGFLAPARQAQFNIAIRTAWIDKHTCTATYGIGGGIVWDSDADAEFDECLAKAGVLRTSLQGRVFNLLETMLWTPADGFFLIDEHMDRLQESAEYFDFRFDNDAILSELETRTPEYGRVPTRVRLQLTRDGDVLLGHSALGSTGSKQPLRIGLAALPVDSDDPFLYHKTTHRDVYDRALQTATDCDDVLLWNADGYITETSTANVLVEKDGQLLTPPVACGLLGGTYRRWLLDTHEIEEREIHIDELAEAQPLQLINSVRGRFPGVLHKDRGQ
jgi:para-aminobenzoate synthetase/4-amino-4-deoxychorismate lyase